MKKVMTYASAFFALVIMLAISITASAAGQPAAPGQNKLLCFDGTTDRGFGGICSLSTDGAKGVGTLNNTDSNPNGDYAGVYIQNTTLSGQLLSAVTQLTYTYSGTVAPTPTRL